MGRRVAGGRRAVKQVQGGGVTSMIFVEAWD